MPTFTAFTTLPAREQAEALGEALEDLTPEPTGVGVFEIEDGSGLWEVGGYFVEAPDTVALAILAAAHGAKDFVISELPETDWVAKVRRDLAPVRAGRFYVYGSHDAQSVPDGVEPLLIEANMAFGTGHHGTTKGCLEAFDALLERGVRPGSVVDIGCGTAVLAMGAARVLAPTTRIIASDIDEVAVEVAAANVGANGLEGRVRCVEAVGTDHADIATSAPYELIFANILMGPLIGLAPDIARIAAPKAYVILSGLLNEQADAVLEAYTAVGMVERDRRILGDWTTLTLQAA